MKQAFIKKRFNEDSLLVIRQVNRIVDEYMEDGYDLTLRQVYYQFVAHDLFPDDRRWRWTGSRWVRDPNGTKNADPNYTWLGSKISDGRLAGLIDWSALVDRTRALKGQQHWASPEELINYYAARYHIDKWQGQQYHVEVWVEKEALIGVLQKICTKLDVDYFACKGYVSQSFMYRAARRFHQLVKWGREPVVIYLGDHDPSGIQMTEDVETRLALLSEEVPMQIRRIALNMDQVEEYAPPENPAKLSDTRAAAYIEEYGYSSWELDALLPQVIENLIRENVLVFRDDKIWNANVQIEEEHKELLWKAARFVEEQQEEY